MDNQGFKEYGFKVQSTNNQGLMKNIFQSSIRSIINFERIFPKGQTDQTGRIFNDIF